METTAQTLLAADLADRWIDAILSEQPDVLLHADTDEPLAPEDMARNLAQFRATLIEELSEQPIAWAMDDDDDEDDDFEGDDEEEAPAAR
ncbi:MAG: hypothetical protein Q4G71_16365 [Pseudomonadota bacterium]|nr:hypothetical protein [Pseudomonadota bacterium]